jgi:hypothetical protein
VPCSSWAFFHLLLQLEVSAGMHICEYVIDRTVPLLTTTKVQSIESPPEKQSY